MFLGILLDFLGWCFLWSCVAVADFSADTQFRKLKQEALVAVEKSTDDEDYEDLDHKDTNKPRQLSNELKSLLSTIFGEGCAKVKYGGDFYFMAISYPVYAVANIALNSLIDDYEILDDAKGVPVKRRLVNMKVSFHFMMACCWILLNGWDKSFNFWKHEPSMPLYNITCFSATVSWFVLLLIEAATPAMALNTPPIEDTILYNLGYMDQSFWSGLYVLTSFYPFGAYTCFGAFWWILGIPKGYINAARKVFHHHPVSYSAFIINVLNPLVAIPMALLFLKARYGQVWEHSLVLYTDASLIVKKNRNNIKDPLSYLEVLPNYAWEELKRLEHSLKKLSRKLKTNEKRS
uniref:TLC domain-containing protein n=2 Tax=Aplanochytrium stocchinoi TaxID=215587 RepID=A0A7S3LP56_9STRA|mmetsp:Transcript_11531/g.15030  ORF Transcript_11531/g.15030 Transcript_11531/m.15030 type:complete len:348 (-) Transcript_11531:247-1290(-)|eukprot:CAMPEP_0204871666 /NCGR_PEP_ID=MMETSP1348-20121228/36138_1 /ASSEMBLY_ACC=CAM_ASM_000700 /TAXON_ID=215587 /ORGANISM="Aplanochytrium stocchinoi, Strain GSBS06" /LENGTH=347 /DNA_ID=CAMNT_0052026111 /DNA_START=202 /DNA_END=1248 /DNA_ORIENTATION=-